MRSLEVWWKKSPFDISLSHMESDLCKGVNKPWFNALIILRAIWSGLVPPWIKKVSTFLVQSDASNILCNSEAIWLAACLYCLCDLLLPARRDILLSQTCCSYPLTDIDIKTLKKLIIFAPAHIKVLHDPIFQSMQLQKEDINCWWVICHWVYFWYEN